MTAWKIDRRQLAKRAVRAAAEQGLQDATEALLEQSNRSVPIEEATLARSGTASRDGLHGVVSYDTPYAARQHEDTRLRHDPGRRAKWLELTLHEERSRLLEHIAEQVRQALR